MCFHETGTVEARNARLTGWTALHRLMTSPAGRACAVETDAFSPHFTILASGDWVPCSHCGMLIPPAGRHELSRAQIGILSRPSGRHLVRMIRLTRRHASAFRKA
jgi:hypothetical protein